MPAAAERGEELAWDRAWDEVTRGSERAVSGEADFGWTLRLALEQAEERGWHARAAAARELLARHDAVRGG